MKTYTIEQIKAHFIGVPYSSSTTFMALLVKNNILVRMSVSTYAYDLDKLSQDVITLIVEECRIAQTKYTKKYHDRINSRKQI